MNEAFIFDTLRTPRGKGRPDGRLHEVNPVDLLAGLMQALQKRQSLDTAEVEDALIGCVMPVGEQSGCIAKTAAFLLSEDSEYINATSIILDGGTMALPPW